MRTCALPLESFFCALPFDEYEIRFSCSPSFFNSYKWFIILTCHLCLELYMTNVAWHMMIPLTIRRFSGSLSILQFFLQLKYRFWLCYSNFTLVLDIFTIGVIYLVILHKNFTSLALYVCWITTGRLSYVRSNVKVWIA